ncbi:glutathione S-transferase family protein [Aestuariivita boseongensis]|uniref:glutathione S-transferase family protein n=1 Tax=Aestuariivita boseongensis TaxID=1470562 RepID=UPI0006819C99|nr:glutathione S-transferase family protein [Aestuariivita boseongensis]
MIGLLLTGFGDSVYTRAVRMALAEKELAYEFTDVNPFEEDGQAALLGHHAFGRVPVLRHYAFELYETAAILGYLEDGFDGPGLTPKGAKARARMRQVMGIVDAYVYWPLVRQVFGHAFYRPAVGIEGEPDVIAAGLAEAPRALDALEEIASAGLVLTGREVTQADCMLLPMIDAFTCVPEGRAMVEARPGLAHWYQSVSVRPSAQDTRPAIMGKGLSHG